MKRYIKSSTQEYPDTFKVGDKITIPLEGIGSRTATCIQICGRRNNQYLFVFDSTVGRSSMTNMDTFLDNLYDRFPENLSLRLRLIRLLQASEVFSNCDDPISWTKLVNWGVKVQNPQIDYFKSVNHRISEDAELWGLSDNLPKLSSVLFAYVDDLGVPYTSIDSSPLNVRPAFIIS